MDKIICLIGASGSGKSSIAARLEQEGYNYIKSYTTRPKRNKTEDGHIFLDESSFNKLKKEELIAYAEFDEYKYWSTKEQYFNKGDSIYVIEPKGAVELKSSIKDCEVLLVYLKVDREERYKRMKDKRGFEMAERRLQYEDKTGIFNNIKCDYIVDANRDMGEVVCNIKKIIQGKLHQDCLFSNNERCR
jgi:guanylate kinase